MNPNTKFLFLTILNIFSPLHCEDYFPVLCVPGVADQTFNLLRVCQEIEKQHNGTITHFVQPGGAPYSFVGMWQQVELYRKALTYYFQKYPDGLHIVAHSQGTLTTRAVLETTPGHPVVNFISVAGPLMGVFGVSFVDKDIFGINLNNLTREEIYKVAYTELAQDTISVAGYWNDPYKQQLFLNISKFLPYINNYKPHPYTEEYRDNFVQLNSTVLIGGDGDEVVIPWQSEHGGFYDENLNIIPMKEYFPYVNDTFGLRTLDEQDRLVIVDVPGVLHNQFVYDLDIVRTYIVPYCT